MTSERELFTTEAGQTAPPAPGGTPGAEAARRQTRQRRLLIYAARAATLVLVVGGWQLLTSWKVIDPFCGSMPTGR